MNCALIWACVLGILLCVIVPVLAHADPQPALDRQLVERLVRAQESQARALEALTRAAERCAR